MITNRNKILKMANGTLICSYCGQPIKIENHKDWDRYFNEKWESYHCDCEEWNKYDKLNQEIRQLDDKYYNILHKIIKEYEKERREIIKKHNENSTVGITPDTESYIWDVCRNKDKEINGYVVR